ncbi:MAG TPA: sugar ABC transporter permease [bacterium]|nr:sugar ABC transporter permease [bacterium]
MIRTPPDGGATDVRPGGAPHALQQRLAASRARRRRVALQKWGPGYVLVLPATVLIAVMMIYPTLQTLRFSISAVRLPTFETTFVGLANFAAVIGDSATGLLLERTIWWVVGTVVLRFVLGFLAALVFNAKVRGTTWMRVLVLLPWTIPAVVAANLWRWILQSDSGILDQSLTAWGLTGWARNWLGNPHTALPAVMIAYSWAGFPFIMLLILAGLRGVPGEQYEAASVDGANWWQLFRFITVPAVKGVLAIALILETVSAVNSFDTLTVMTGGGPANATQTWSLAIYRAGFVDFNLGGASALSVLMFLGALVLLAVYSAANRGGQVKQAWR